MAERRATPDRPGAQEWVPPDGDVDALAAAAPACRGCELWAPATQVVVGAGPPDARVVLVGEQPGDREDLAGEPFVGPAGRVLHDGLRDAGLDAGAVYVTNAVKHFRFTERGRRRLHKSPAVAHVRACHPWLGAELAAVGPRVVVCLGATAARSVLGRDVTVGELRGRLLDEHPAEAPDATVLVTVHPSAVLRLRGRAGWDEAYAGFVADLRAAGAAVG
ncbi:UdgX family uracil-DNA binding protein [Cellulomonas pakistanensis]|uniref:Type-4 uracil-DNA glycosylase n=1 Tax=Cellulomonas pakistanensis TaxID=992287 RepID=A0A919U557_9CELL|nr:UdgX family uracil-DNA binding protein [Cellulomonas pakistanensis]GIG38216.1 uracil-DNA glycosylase [Cellulomonas pakistanensis]